MNHDKLSINMTKGTRPRLKKWAAKEGVKKLNGEPHMAEFCRKLIDEGLARREEKIPE